MTNLAHDKLRVEMINKYSRLGYKKMKRSKRYPVSNIVPGYIPDEIMENDEEILLLEAVDHNDHDVILPENYTFKGKKVTFVKEYVPNASKRKMTVHTGEPTHRWYNVKLDDELSIKFKSKVINKYGRVRGNQNHAFVEAVRDWVEAEVSE